jgi:nucleotide-binding universal stress UspA family protein
VVDERVIVVGVNSSTESRTALRWALNEAMRTGARVEATTAWDRTSATTPYPAHELHDAVARARAEVPDAPDVAEVMIVGDASAVLLAASRQADLLVVGMREHTAATAGVALDCVRHAAWPVVVVRPGTAGRPAHIGRTTASGHGEW